MTFTEAAIEVLRREGKPLHFNKLTEIAVRENLLDHVGKIPEETMADQLAAHCRLPRAERRLVPVQQGTFALPEWGIEEDPSALEGLVEAPPEGEPAYRSRERHPIPSRELSRAARGERGERGERGDRGERDGRPRRRDDEERRSRRFPPPAEVAYEILAGAGKPLTLVEIATTGAERLLMPDAFVRDDGPLRAALGEDNRRRESGGRKALFQIDGDSVTLVAQPEPGERAVPAALAAAPRAASTLAEIRRTALAALRRRLRECDGPTVEHVAMKLLERLGFRELKVAKRGREHLVCTGKRRMGVADVRHAVRIVRGGADAGRRDVQDLRRDVGHYGAQIGIVITPGEAAREARAEAVMAGQLPVVLLCGEALAEAFADAGVGCTPVVVPEVDETFFRTAAETAEGEELARRARREERDRRDAPRRPEAEAFAAEDDETPAPARSERREGALPREVSITREVLITDAARDSDASDADAEGDDDGEEGTEEGVEAEGAAAEGGEGRPASAEGEGGAAGERRRRRRRRRRRGGRGRAGKDAATGAPAAGAAAEGATSQAGAAPDSGSPSVAPSGPAPEAPPPLPSGEPTGGEGS